MELWNIGFHKDINHFNFIVNPAVVGEMIQHCTILSGLRLYSKGWKRRGGQNPLFHYSSIPTFQL